MSKESLDISSDAHLANMIKSGKLKGKKRDICKYSFNAGYLKALQEHDYSRFSKLIKEFNLPKVGSGFYPPGGKNE